jgi:hypothetical protein
MATQKVQIDESMIGQPLPFPNGFIFNLVMTTPPPRYLTPRWSDSKQCWTEGYLSLKGSADLRPLICVNLSQGATNPPCTASGAFLIGDNAIGFRGSLMVESVPRGAVYQATLSDVVKQPSSDTPLAAADKMLREMIHGWRESPARR